MTVTTATIQGIKQLSYPPVKGEHYLSVNLALADPAEVWEVAKNLNFKPELVQISSKSGIEIHALLFHEQTSGEPMNTPALDVKIAKSCIFCELAPKIRHEKPCYMANAL